MSTRPHQPPSTATLEALLLEEKLVLEEALRDARRVALRRRLPLLEVLVDEHAVDEGQVADALARRLGIQRVTLGALDEDALREVPHDLASAHQVIPMHVDTDGTRRTLRLAMANPLDLLAIEDVAQGSGCRVEPAVATLSELRVALHRSYRGMITKMIPRLGDDLRPAVEPTTQPHLHLPDETSLEVRLRALIEILVERGVLGAGEVEERVRRLVHGEDV